MNKLWLTKKSVAVYDNYKGDTNNPASWICISNDLTILRSNYEVESLYEDKQLNRLFIRALYENKYWYAWVDKELLKPAPIRYSVRQINQQTWEVYNTKWDKKPVEVFESLRIAQTHATKLNARFRIGQIGIAWFSLKDCSWAIELIPAETSNLLRPKPSDYEEFYRLSLEQQTILNNGKIFTFHPYRDLDDVRRTLFKVMRQRFKIEPLVKQY